MRRTLTWTGSTLFAIALVGGCAANEPNRQRDNDDDGGTSGSGNQAGSAPLGGSSGTGPTGGTVGNSGGSSGTSPTGGTAPTAGTGTLAGTGGTVVEGTGGTGPVAGTGGSSVPGPVTCSNTDKTTLPIDATGWVARECNERGIQGPFYCYDDNINPSSCVQDMVPWVAGKGLCLSGDTTLDDTYMAWGAGIALGLNESGTMGGTQTSVKMPYNATMAGVTGFQVSITGTTGDLPLRIGFTGAAEQVGAAPFIEVPGAGDYTLDIATALVPEAWETDPNAGVAADPSNIFDMQIQVVGATAAAHYDFCIASVTPILDGMTPPVTTLQPYGSRQCDNFSKITLGNRYMVQNNLYGGGGTQCITAAFDNGDKSGFTVEPQLNVAGGGPPASYPSVVYGWHVDGAMYGAYQSAKQLSAIASAPTSFTHTEPAAGRWNASYDIWIHNSQAKPSGPGGTLELMIWLAKRDTTPIGSEIGTVMIGGQNWVVWYGTHDGFSTVSYVMPTNVQTISNMDLKPFFDDAVQRGYATASAYLLGIQAGFEIWEGTQPMTVNSFQVSVN